jgi:hypothetical protein
MSTPGVSQARLLKRCNKLQTATFGMHTQYTPPASEDQGSRIKDNIVVKKTKKKKRSYSIYSRVREKT